LEHVVPLDPEQRSRLLAAKLRALVRDGFGADVDAGVGAVFPGGAALLIPPEGGARDGAGPDAWVLLDERPAGGLGRALAWAEARTARDLHVLADDEADVLARRASQFARPPSVWWVDGRSVRPAAPAEAHVTAPPPTDALDLVPLLAEAGVEIVVEHGHVIGELRGLEIARVVVDGEGARVEVGVGRHDREAFAVMHGDVPAPDALARVFDDVRRHRRADAPPHPLGRLAAERWLRAAVLAQPGLVGALDLVTAEGTVERTSVKDPAPAIAVGRDAGGPVVVACSVGVDLDLVPAAADARLALAPDARLVLVVPERDAQPVTARLAAALTVPAELRAVPDDWRAVFPVA
jgi:hypothetical protein